MNSVHFRFSPQILRRLGEELVPNVDQGIVELVRNAYDADAVTCEVELLDTHEVGGTVRITDDGLGMNEQEIASGWLLLGRSGKASPVPMPTPLGRLPVGDKGLGRLAALRMGSVAVLRTRPKNEIGTEYRLELNWERYETVESVEDVGLQIQRLSTKDEPGTTIEIHDLRVCIGRSEAQRLARSLILLADPFGGITGFRPRLKTAAFTELEKRVENAYFNEAEYKICAELDDQGRASARVVDWKEQRLFSAEHERLSNSEAPYDTAAATFDLWVFLMNADSFAARSSDATVSEVRSWLKVVGGVHLYQRSLRVHPYGDPGYDWLEMNLARVRSPEERPSTNTSVGRIIVRDNDAQLIQKTDRSGFIENAAFRELKRFATDTLRWTATNRLALAEERRKTGRVESSKSAVEAKQSLQDVLTDLPEESRAPISEAVARLEQAHKRETKDLRNEVQLYRTLATVGTTAAVFAHESGQPNLRIERAAREMEALAADELGLFDRNELMELAQIVKRSAHSLQSFAVLPIKMLQHGKRRTGRVDVHTVITDVLGVFQPFLNEAQIDTTPELAATNSHILGSVAAVESIYANLLTNAANAVIFGKVTVTPRRILTRTEMIENRFLLRVLDNGSGIRGITVDDIWLPGRTTKDGGVGLGLTIVRDSVADLGGETQVKSYGGLGGAEFTIILPVLGT